MSNRIRRVVVISVAASAGVLLLCALEYQGAPTGENMATVVRGRQVAAGSPDPLLAPPHGAEANAPPGEEQTLVVSDAELFADTNDPFDLEAVLTDLPLPETSPFTGNLTDLSPSEEGHARDVFIRERAKWARFKGLSGQLSLHFVDTAAGQEASLECQVDIGSQPPDDNRSRAGKLLFYEMTLRDREGKWAVVLDGKTRPRIRCEDAALRATIIRCILRGGILEAFDMPRRALTQLALGDDVSGGGLEPERFFAVYQAFHSKVEGFADAPDSYMFEWVPTVGEVQAFTAGRFCYWGDKGRLGQQQARLYFQNYESIDGFDFPTAIVAHLRTQRVEMKFSQCKITTLP